MPFEEMGRYVTWHGQGGRNKKNATFPRKYSLFLFISKVEIIQLQVCLLFLLFHLSRLFWVVLLI